MTPYGVTPFYRPFGSNQQMGQSPYTPQQNEMNNLAGGLLPQNQPPRLGQPSQARDALSGTPLHTFSPASPYTGPGINPSFQWRGNGLPTSYANGGWQVGNDGRWYPPGTMSQPQSVYRAF